LTYLGFSLREKLLLYSSKPSLGVFELGGYLHNHHRATNKFSGAVAGEEKRRILQGKFHTHILYFVLSSALLYFYLRRFIKNTKKLVSFIVVTLLLLVHYVVS
jgi:hypothetical protein